MKLAAKTRKQINRGLHGLPTFHKSAGLAFAAALEVLAPHGLWAGLNFIPKTGTVRLIVSHGKPETAGEVENSLLVIQTHEMESTGRIELTTYMS